MTDVGVAIKAWREKADYLERALKDRDRQIKALKKRVAELEAASQRNSIGNPTNYSPTHKKR